jgi:uncharacterized protein YcaQ
VVHELSRADARRVAVRAQLLDAPRPADLLDVVRQLTLVQVDQTAAVAPSADLVAWSRLGAAYTPEMLADARAGRALVELQGMIRPAEDIALYRADMAAWPVKRWQKASSDWVIANDACRRDILARLADDGPLAARELPDTCTVPGRIYPEEPPVPAAEARHRRDELRLRSLGIAWARAAECPVEPQHVGEAGEAAVIEGVKGEWRVDPAYLDGSFSGRTAALLSPLDRLVFDRKRTLELFGFDYQLEMYKPAAKRRWGYYALPILVGDRLVGKLDVTADRPAGVLRVDAIHEDIAWPDPMRADVYAEIAALADWLELDLVMR